MARPPTAMMRGWFPLTVLGVMACSSDLPVGENEADVGGSAGTPAAVGGAGGTGPAGSAGLGGAAGNAGFGPSQGGTLASGGNSGSAPVGGGAGAGSCAPAECQSHIYQCGDCLDNDGDGLVDQQDPDCLGACDNTEDSYYGGIPGQNQAPCRQDCYFDQDTGNNDGCYWNHRCDPLSVAAEFPPSGDVQCAYDADANTPGSPASCAELGAQQSPECERACGPLTPNGCDCFGCCELPAGSGSWVWLGSTTNGAGSCDLANVGDPTQCHPCTPVPGCLNTCERCELCLGKTSVPADCSAGVGGSSNAGGSGGSAGTGDSQCSDGRQPCGLEGQALCPTTHYCITGCCVETPR